MFFLLREITVVRIHSRKVLVLLDSSIISTIIWMKMRCGKYRRQLNRVLPGNPCHTKQIDSVEVYWSSAILPHWSSNSTVSFLPVLHTPYANMMTKIALFIAIECLEEERCSSQHNQLPGLSYARPKELHETKKQTKHITKRSCLVHFF